MIITELLGLLRKWEVAVLIRFQDLHRLLGCFVTFLASKSLIYDTNIKMKMKSNHPFVESPSPFCSLTIVNHHSSQLLLLLSRLVPHLYVSSNVNQKNS